MKGSIHVCKVKEKLDCTSSPRRSEDRILNDTAPLLRRQARIVLRYSLISAAALSDCASEHLVLWYSLISATTLSISASLLLLCATEPQYYTVPSVTYYVVSYSFLITNLSSQTVI